MVLYWIRKKFQIACDWSHSKAVDRTCNNNMYLDSYPTNEKCSKIPYSTYLDISKYYFIPTITIISFLLQYHSVSVDRSIESLWVLQKKWKKVHTHLLNHYKYMKKFLGMECYLHFKRRWNIKQNFFISTMLILC